MKRVMLMGTEVNVIKFTDETATYLNAKTGHIHHASREWFLDNATAFSTKR